MGAMMGAALLMVAEAPARPVVAPAPRRVLHPADSRRAACAWCLRDPTTLGQFEEVVDNVWGNQGPMCAAHMPFFADWPNVWTVVSTAQKPYMVGGWHPSKAQALYAAYVDSDGGEAE